MAAPANDVPLVLVDYGGRMQRVNFDLTRDVSDLREHVRLLLGLNPSDFRLVSGEGPPPATASQPRL